MSYALGIDLGTTYSAAAIDESGRAEVVSLGSHAAVVPSVVLLRSDGEVLTGEAAERRALAEPARAAREFKRRLGDPTPLILGGTPYAAESVMSLLLRAIVGEVAEQKGEAPATTCLTHPASWGPFKRDLLEEAVRQADIGEVTFLTEPEAAAAHYAAQERVDQGTVVAVYDFGGGTFDATVLRKTGDSFELLGKPEGLDRLGGIDFDEAVFQLVSRALGGKLEELDGSNGTVQAAVARLRGDCRIAKEALSDDTEALVSILLPNVQTEVRITRGEFEALIAPRLGETIRALERSVRSAGIEMQDVDRILLVGGTSRIPLIASTVRDLTGRPVVMDVHPKHAIALGAAAEARRRGVAVQSTAVGLRAESEPAVAGTESTGPAGLERSGVSNAPATPSLRGYEPLRPDPAAEHRPDRRPEGASRGRLVLGGALVLGAVAVGAIIVMLVMIRGGGEGVKAGPNEPSVVGSFTPQSAASDSPTATPTLAANTARITGIEVLNGRYSVTFETGGYTPKLPGQHVHFFFDTVTPQQAGVPGSGPWFVYGGGSPFTGYSPGERPAGARQMCILVANPDHSVKQSTGNCFPLP